MKDKSGFEELQHTADLAMRAWAPTLEGLFVEAAMGMYALSGVKMGNGPTSERSLQLEEKDPEALLVAFLTELLFLTEQERLVFDQFDIQLHQGRLNVTLKGAPLCDISRTIKAVTFHNLHIQGNANGFETQVVFDV